MADDTEGTDTSGDAPSSSDATGYGGFGGLGIGNPGSYGGQQSVGAPGFEGDYGKGDDSYDKAYDGFTTGNYAYGFKNLVDGLIGTAIEYGVSFLGGKIGLAVGATFGGYGPIIGYLVGKYVGSKLGELVATELIKAEDNNLSDNDIDSLIEKLASDNGTTAEDIISKITEGMKEEGVESLIEDISNNYQGSSYYDMGLSRRRSNIIGTGRRGLTIE